MSGAQSLSGFVLVGGASVRMGTNKALLPFRGNALAEHIARELGQVTQTVCLVGQPALYAHLGFPVVADEEEGRGPLSGIEAALQSRFAAEWNLIAACDMPLLDAAVFRELERRAGRAGQGTDCIVPITITPVTSGRLQPLCAVYRKRCAITVTAALEKGTRRVVDAVAMLQAELWPAENAHVFQNVNTFPEWDRFLRDRQAPQPHDRRIPALP